MTLARDSSSPAAKQSGFIGISPGSVTSNSFSPPGGSAVFVTSWTEDSFANDWAPGSQPSITDSLGSHLTWNLIVNQFDNGLSGPNSRIAVWWAYAGASAPGSMTVTVTDSVTSGQYIQLMGIAVDVWTGAKTSGPAGAIVSGSQQAAASGVTQSITPQASGSALVMAGGVTTSDTITAGSGMYLNNVAYAWMGAAWQGTSSGPALTTSTSPQSLSLALSSGTSQWQYAAYEVLAAGSPPPASPAGLLLGSFP
jgi:hypothetical protein